jgi:hypothetical protein
MDTLINGKYEISTADVVVEIGDTKQEQFYPQAKLAKWDNEANFSLRLASDITGANVAVDQSQKLVWTAADGTEAHIYSITDGFEFEVVYKAPPASNIVSFTIETKELEFLYQPALSQVEIDRGAKRPENVVGSYAAYHLSKRDNKYQTGKAFHIYRPKATDAKGDTAWCELNIDTAAKILSVTVPQKFLDSAQYPVIVDPTFGYTTVGASTQDLADIDGTLKQCVNYFVTAPGNISIDSISAYLDIYDQPINCKPVIWDGTALPADVITSGAGGATSSGSGTGWKILPYTVKPAVSNGVDYRLGFAADVIDDGGTHGAAAYYDGWGGSAPDYENFNYLDGVNYSSPQAWTSNGSTSLGRVSIYATYSTGSLLLQLLCNTEFSG